MEDNYKFNTGDVLYRIFGDDYYIFGGSGTLIPEEEITVIRYVVRAFRVKYATDFCCPKQYRLCAINQIDVQIRERGWILFDSELETCLNPPLENIQNGWSSLGQGQIRFSDCVFDDYNTAVMVADTLTNRELAALAGFNARHNTSCEPSFTAVHDEYIINKK